MSAPERHRLRHVAPFAAAALVLILVSAWAAPAQAGIVVTSQGVVLTPPDPSLAPVLGPARGFRRFGRAGYFAAPRDPGLPFHGRNAFGPAGRALDDRIRVARGPRKPEDSIFTGAISSWFD